MRTSNRLAGSILVLVTAVAAPAAAGDPGTHFLVEPYSGMMFNHGFSAENQVGLESGGLLAVGGKFKGFPPRFYAYFKASYAMFGSDELVLERGAHACIERSYTRLMGGLRTVIPLFSSYLRLNLEFGVGGLLSSNRYSESGGPRLSYDETLTVVEFGAGLNWRIFRWLSLGLMYDYTLVAEDEHGDLIATIVGQADHGNQVGWSHLSLTLGFHF